MGGSRVSSTLWRWLPFTRYPYQGESVSCDLCGGAESLVICEHDRRLKRLRTVACRRCGLMRTDPMPTLEEIARYYADTFRRDYQMTPQGPSRRHLTRSHREAARRLERLGPAIRPGARVLDFGSGAGVFLSRAKAARCEVLGLEPGRRWAAFATRTFGVPVISDVWEHADPPGPFDVITAVEVLEHLRRPVQALGWLARRLAPDGVLYVSVPNMLPNRRETFRRFHFAHLHHFTPTTLRWAGVVAGVELDPRYPAEGTKLTFRRVRGAAPSLELDRNQGDGLPALYADASIAHYLLTGRWFTAAGKRLRKTVRDHFARS